MLSNHILPFTIAAFWGLLLVASVMRLLFSLVQLVSALGLA
jgi:hypothetical protein